MIFTGLKKSWILGKMTSRGHGKVMEFHFFSPNISFCLETGSIFLVIAQKYAPKKLGFQYALVMESLN